MKGLFYEFQYISLFNYQKFSQIDLFKEYSKDIVDPRIGLDLQLYGAVAQLQFEVGRSGFLVITLSSDNKTNDITISSFQTKWLLCLQYQINRAFGSILISEIVLI